MNNTENRADYRVTEKYRHERREKFGRRVSYTVYKIVRVADGKVFEKVGADAFRRWKKSRELKNLKIADVTKG